MNRAPLPSSPGVYVITNVVTGRLYVGSAKNLRTRVLAHRWALLANKHDNEYLQRSFNEHGHDSFTVSVIELCDELERVAREQHFIDLLRATDRSIGYNIRPSAAGNATSAETGAKIRAALKGHKVSEETREKLRMANIGKKHSIETRSKMRANNVGKTLSQESILKRTIAREGFTHSPEAREKLRVAHTGRKQTPEHIANNVAANIGRQHSQETREKLRRAAIRQWQRVHGAAE